MCFKSYRVRKGIGKRWGTGFFAYTPEQFENQVEKLIINPDLRSRVGRAAHKEVWKKYSLRNHVNILLDHINKLVNN